MPELFNASDILEAAIRIEENGEVFYRDMAKKVKDVQVRQVFELLANENVKHQRIFADLLAQVDDTKPLEEYSGEYMDYLYAFADHHVFNQENMGRLKAKQIKTTRQALKFAIQIELDSLLFYLDAKNLVPEAQAEVISRILEEERRHYLKLQKMKNDLKL